MPATHEATPEHGNGNPRLHPGPLHKDSCFSDFVSIAFFKGLVLISLPGVAAALERREEHAARETYSYPSPAGSLLLTFSKWLQFTDFQNNDS